MEPHYRRPQNPTESEEMWWLQDGSQVHHILRISLGGRGTVIDHMWKFLRSECASEVLGPSVRTKELQAAIKLKLSGFQRSMSKLSTLRRISDERYHVWEGDPGSLQTTFWCSVTKSWQMEEGRPWVSKLRGKPVGEPIMCPVLPPYLPGGCLPPVG